MSFARSTLLAIDGGEPVRTTPLPSGFYGPREIGEEEAAAIQDVLRRQVMFRFSLPPEESYASRLEAEYRRLTGRAHALAVNGGTSALIAGLVGLGVSTGDEVIVPGYTYIATAAAVLSVGAIPVIAEIDETLTLDCEDFERKITPLTRCVIPVHMRGLPARMDEIMAIARSHGLKVLEDVAQANGGMYMGRLLGTIGDAGAFSFQQSKIVTSAEGGMLVTDDPIVYERAAWKHDSALQFWRPGAQSNPFAGENYRMCELRAALGYTQFQRLPAILGRTRALKKRLVAGLEGTPGIKLLPVNDPEGECGIIVGFYLPTAEEAKRFSQALRAEGIKNATIYNQDIPDRHIYAYWDYVLNKWTADRTGYPWSPQFYKGNVEYSRDMCPRTLDYLGRIIMINIHHRWSDEDADDVVRAVRKVGEAYYGSRSAAASR